MANPFEKPHVYGDGTDSTVGANLINFYYYRDAMIDAAKEAYFGQLADVRAMPKHYGKKIKQYHYIPLLDDRNINDQGIDATGSSIANEVTIVIVNPSGMVYRAVGNGTNAATALTSAQARAMEVFSALGVAGASYAATVTTLTGLTPPWNITEGTAVNSYGNLWGSSKDIGYIADRLPTIGEEGGRVNRVGFTRVELEGQIERYGFFEEYTEDSLNFDNEEDLLSHYTRESVRGANEVVEGLIQMDLLGGAGVVVYGGNATSMATVTGENGATHSVLTYDLLMKTKIILDDNRCPKDTKLIAGSQMVDTKVIPSARYAYIGSVLETTLHKMKDYHGDRAFMPIQAYADAGKVARGEIGSVGNYRFIVVPEMYHWAEAGATVTTNDGYHEQNGRYNVYPCLVVGSNSFATIGFQTDGKNVKFRIIHRKPGEKSADRHDPYGLTGFYSIHWWYGSMILRPEWIACFKVVAEL